MIWRETLPDSDTTSPSSWHLLPDDILRTICKLVWLGDRVRARLVCKSWERILARDSVPMKPEAPWEILSNDSYRKPETCLKEICFRSLSEERVYRFRLPPTGKRQLEDGWCFCGSSRGWLLIAGKETMLLWQPLSGDTRKLPSPSTLPFFNDLEVTGRIKNLSSAVHRVEVISECSNDCVVVVIFRRNNACSEIALCTPGEQKWKIVSGGQLRPCYSDILFHIERRELFALATDIHISRETRAFKDFMGQEIISLARCGILVRKIFLPDVVRIIPEAPCPLGLQHKGAYHLVESALTNRIIIVQALFECFACKEGDDNEPDNVVGFRRQRTAHFYIGAAMFTGQEGMSLRERKLKIMSGVGEETIFLGASGSFSTSAVGGTEPNCIHFATDDAQGLALRNDEHDKDYYVVREHGVFSFKHNKMQQTSFTAVRRAPRSRVGWFTPQLLYKKKRNY